VRVSWVVFPELQGDTLMQVIAVKAGHRGARVQRIAGRHFGRPDPRGRALQRRLITTLSEACDTAGRLRTAHPVQANMTRIHKRSFHLD
jgi:hypothetical protein